MKEEIINCAQIYAKKNRKFNVYPNDETKNFENGYVDKVFVSYNGFFLDDLLEIGYKGIYWNNDLMRDKGGVSWKYFLFNLNNRDQELGFIEFKKGSVLSISNEFELMFSFLKNIRSIVWKHYYGEYYEELNYKEIENYEEGNFEEDNFELKDLDFSLFDYVEEKPSWKYLSVETEESKIANSINYLEKLRKKKHYEEPTVFSLEDPYITED